MTYTHCDILHSDLALIRKSIGLIVDEINNDEQTVTIVANSVASERNQHCGGQGELEPRRAGPG